MATERSQPHPAVTQHSISELIVSRASGNLLDIEPHDFGPGSPASAALQADRGPEPEPRAAASGLP